METHAYLEPQEGPQGSRLRSRRRERGGVSPLRRSALGTAAWPVWLGKSLQHADGPGMAGAAEAGFSGRKDGSKYELENVPHFVSATYCATSGKHPTIHQSLLAKRRVMH